MRSALLILAMIAAPLWAAEVKVAETVKVKPGRLAKITATSDDKAPIVWINVHDVADLIESETGRWAVFSSSVPGKYKLALMSSAGGQPAYCTVIVDGTPPAPVPPDPIPVPPDPIDTPLRAAVRVAYAKEAAPEKEKWTQFMAAVFAASSALVDASSTVGDLFAKLSTALHAPGVGFPRGAIPYIVAAATQPLKDALGTDAAAPLDKAKAKAALALAADALGAAIPKKGK